MQEVKQYQIYLDTKCLKIFNVSFSMKNVFTAFIGWLYKKPL